MEKKRLTLGEAVDDFAQHVEPNLFPAGRKNNKDYYRVKNLLYARKDELAGKRPRREITAEWVQTILSEFAPGRYEFGHYVDVIIY